MISKSNRLNHLIFGWFLINAFLFGAPDYSFYEIKPDVVLT